MIPGSSSQVRLYSPFIAIDLLVVHKTKKEREINNSIPPTWEYEKAAFNQGILKGKYIFPC